MKSASSDPSSTSGGTSPRAINSWSRRRFEWRVGSAGICCLGTRGFFCLGAGGFGASLERPATASGIPRASRRARLRAMLQQGAEVTHMCRLDVPEHRELNSLESRMRAAGCECCVLCWRMQTTACTFATVVMVEHYIMHAVAGVMWSRTQRSAIQLAQNVRWLDPTHSLARWSSNSVSPFVCISVNITASNAAVLALLYGRRCCSCVHTGVSSQEFMSTGGTMLHCTRLKSYGTHVRSLTGHVL